MIQRWGRFFRSGDDAHKSLLRQQEELHEQQRLLQQQQIRLMYPEAPVHIVLKVLSWQP